MASGRILAGFHSVGARLRSAPGSIEIVYADSSRRDARMRQMIERLEGAGVRWTPADGERLRGLTGGLPHQGLVAVCEERSQALSFDELLDQVDAPCLLLLLDGVTDPRNLGACLRVADAAGVRAVIVPRDRSAGLGADAARASAGAIETVPLVAVTNLSRAMGELREAGVTLIGTDAQAATSIYEVPLSGAAGWVLGAEDHGLRRLTRERCDHLARIPLRGSVESLNVAVAAGICLFESVRRAMPAASA